MSSPFYQLGAKLAAEPFTAGAVPDLAPSPLAPKSPDIPKPKPGEISSVIEPPSLKGNSSGLGALPSFGPSGGGGGGKKTAQRKLSRRMKFRGLDISIETDKGEKREWYDPHNDEHGSTTMQYPYGYIRRTEGVDGDHVDVYVGPNEHAANVYVVHQMKAPKFTQYDEDKCMLGFDSASAAKKAYLAHYNDDRFFGKIRTMPFNTFKTRVLKTFEQPQKLAYALGVRKALEKLGALGLKDVLKIEGLLGKDVAARMFRDIDQQMGRLGKGAIRSRPQTAIIGPQGVTRIPLKPVPPPLPVGV